MVFHWGRKKIGFLNLKFAPGATKRVPSSLRAGSIVQIRGNLWWRSRALLIGGSAANIFPKFDYVSLLAG